MKCLLCFIKGHKWWIRNFEDKIEDGMKHRYGTSIELTHCDRCGEENPRLKNPKTILHG